MPSINSFIFSKLFHLEPHDETFSVPLSCYLDALEKCRAFLHQAEHAQVFCAMNKCTKLRKIVPLPRKI